jgi:TonB family protein
LVAIGSFGDSFATSLGVHVLLVAFLALHTQRSTSPLLEVDLIADPELAEPEPEEVRKAPPPAERAPEIEAAPVPLPEPPQPHVRESLTFLRSDGLAPAERVDSVFISDQDARALVEGRSLADLQAAPIPTSPGLLPSPEGGMGPTHMKSNELQVPKAGEEDAGDDRPTPGEPARTMGAPLAGAPEPSNSMARSEQSEAVDALAAVRPQDLAALMDRSRGDLAAGAGSASTIAAPTEAREARARTERSESDGDDGPPVDRSSDGDAIADASTIGETPDRDAPEGGGSRGDGRTGADSDRSLARDGASGRHTLPGELGAPSQLQAAPLDLPLEPGAMLSVTGSPLGPWLVLVDAALRERWQPPPDMRLRTGTAVVSFSVSRQGRVMSVELERGSGHGDLDALALASIPGKVPAPSPIAGERVYVRYSFRTGP